jgi:hypothetical protein
MSDRGGRGPRRLRGTLRRSGSERPPQPPQRLLEPGRGAAGVEANEARSTELAASGGAEPRRLAGCLRIVHARAAGWSRLAKGTCRLPP